MGRWYWQQGECVCRLFQGTLARCRDERGNGRPAHSAPLVKVHLTPPERMAVVLNEWLFKDRKRYRYSIITNREGVTEGNTWRKQSFLKAVCQHTWWVDNKRADKTFCGGLEEPDVLPDPGRARCVYCSSPAGSFLPHAVAENAERHHFSDAQTPLNSRDLRQKRHILKT